MRQDSIWLIVIDGLRPGLWTPKVTTLDDIFRCNVFYLRRLASDLETQFKGIVAIVDLKNLGIHHVRQVTPSYAKKVAALIQVFEKRQKECYRKNPIESSRMQQFCGFS